MNKTFIKIKSKIFKVFIQRKIAFYIHLKGIDYNAEEETKTFSPERETRQFSKTNAIFNTNIDRYIELLKICILYRYPFVNKYV